MADPGLPPPPGQSMESRKDIPICVAVFTLLVAAIAVGLRLFTRKVLINQVGIDDYCAIAAFLLVLACDFAVAYNTNFGLGEHIWNVPPEDVPLYLRTFYVSIAMYNASLMAIKMTFLAQYHRIFQHSSRSIRGAFVGAATFVLCWALSQLLVAVFTCHPISGYWDPDEHAVCVPDYPFWEINAAGNIVTDVCVLVLPIPIIRKLNLPRRQKCILIGIFSLGLFTVCISLIRIRFLRQYDDFTWENVESSGWSMGELASGLTCACLPTLRPLVARFAPWLSSRAGSYFGGGGGTGGGNTGEKDPERGGWASSASGAGSTTLGGGPGSRGRSDDWPLLSPLSAAAAAARLGINGNGNGSGVPRVDSGGDNSDGVVGLKATRDALDKDLEAGGGVGGGGGTITEKKDGRHVEQVEDRAAAAPPPHPGPVVVRPAVPPRRSSVSSQRRPSTSNLSRSRRSSQESVRWAHPTVQAEIRSPTPVFGPSGSAAPAGLPRSAIRVERDVYQTKEPAYHK